MIRVDVEEYCSDCEDFQAEVERPSKMFANGGRDVFLTDTVITCTNRKRCEAIRRYLERGLKDGETGQ